MNPNLARFAQMAAPMMRGPMPPMMPPGGMPPMNGPPMGQGGPMPPMGPSGAPPMPPGARPMPAGQPPAAGMPPPGGAAPPRMPGPQGMPPQPNPLAAKIGSVIRPVGPQNAAAQGRGGDTMVAHMTPGEIAVPPQVQTPDVLAALNKAFSQAGANPTSFQAGSPDQKINPTTGMPEFDFLSSVLPMALAIGGSALLGPEIIPLLGAGGLGIGAETAGLLGPALGGALGSTAGNLLTGQGILPSLASGAGAGLGSAAGGLLGGMGGSSGALNNTPGTTGPSASTPDPVTGDYGGGSDAGNKSFLDKALAGLMSKQSMGAAIGGLLPGMLFPQSTQVPANVSGPPMTPMSQLPPLSSYIGGGSGNSATGAIPFGAPRRPPIGYRPGIDPQFNYFGPG